MGSRGTVAEGWTCPLDSLAEVVPGPCPWAARPPGPLGAWGQWGAVRPPESRHLRVLVSDRPFWSLRGVLRPRLRHPFPDVRRRLGQTREGRPDGGGEVGSVPSSEQGRPGPQPGRSPCSPHVGPPPPPRLHADSAPVLLSEHSGEARGTVRPPEQHLEGSGSCRQPHPRPRGSCSPPPSQPVTPVLLLAGPP